MSSSLSKNEELLQAAEDGDASKVLSLIAGGADVRAKDNNGGTPLHWAGWNGHAAVVEALLANGADVRAKTDAGNTPLHLAGAKGHAAVVEALLANGADVRAKTNYGRTPLHYAGAKGHAAVVEALLANGADVRAKDNYGNAPLHSAGSRGHVNVVEVLLTNGADPNSKNINGSTPLHEGGGNGFAAIAEALLAKGANIHAKNNYGWTPLHCLSECCDCDDGMTVRVMLAFGADVKAKDRAGKTPSDVAASSALGRGFADLIKTMRPAKRKSKNAGGDSKTTRKEPEKAAGLAYDGAGLDSPDDHGNTPPAKISNHPNHPVSFFSDSDLSPGRDRAKPSVTTASESSGEAPGGERSTPSTNNPVANHDQAPDGSTNQGTTIGEAEGEESKGETASVVDERASLVGEIEQMKRRQQEMEEALASKDEHISLLISALKRKNVEVVDLVNETGAMPHGEPPSQRARTENEAVSTPQVKEERKDGTEEEDELEVEVIETNSGQTNGRVTRSKLAAEPTVKRENILHGDIRCPDPACNEIISFAGNRGCNVIACRSGKHSPSFLYFCIHCKQIAGNGYATCECPKRNTMEDRIEAQEMRNERSRQNPEVLE